MPDKLDIIADDVAEVKRWTERHERRHGDDADMLGRVLDDLQVHLTNHHGRLSTIKQGGAIGTALALLGGLAEILRRLFLA